MPRKTQSEDGVFPVFYKSLNEEAKLYAACRRKSGLSFVSTLEQSKLKMKRCWAGEVRNVSLLVAIGVNDEGYRDVLGIVEGHKEDKAGWSGLLSHLKDRGLKGVQLILSDACMGLVESASEYYPDALWQRCTVHWYRIISFLLSQAPRSER